MKFLKEDFEDEFQQDDFMNDYDDTTDDVSPEVETSEIEMTLGEPSKLVDADGSVVLVGAGDIVTIQSESLKRIRK